MNIMYWLIKRSEIQAKCFHFKINIAFRDDHQSVSVWVTSQCSLLCVSAPDPLEEDSVSQPALCFLAVLTAALAHWEGLLEQSWFAPGRSGGRPASWPFSGHYWMIHSSGVMTVLSWGNVSLSDLQGCLCRSVHFLTLKKWGEAG